MPEEISESKRRWIAIKLFEGDELIRQQVTLTPSNEKELAEIIKITEMIFDEHSDAIIVNERYEFIQQLLALATIKEEEYRLSLSDKIDRVLTNRLLALPIFAFFMWGIYFLSIQTIGTMGTDWVNDVLFGSWVPDILQQLMNQWQVAQWLQELIQDGIVAGVGAVLGFVPQIFVLFFLFGFIRRLWLHGTNRFCDGSFVPEVWLIWEILHSDADRYWLWGSRSHGEPDHRK